MGDEEVDVVDPEPGLGHGAHGRLAHGGDGAPEHLGTVHADAALGRRGSAGSTGAAIAWHLQDVPHRAVHAQLGGQQAHRLLGGLEHHRPGRVPEQDRRGAIGEVEVMMELLCSHHQHRPVGAGPDHVGGHHQ